MAGRRANNEGSVYFDKTNGKWICAVPYRTSEGHRRTVRKRFTSYRAANEHRRELVKKRDTTAPSSDMLFGAFVAHVRKEVWPKSGRKGRPLAAKTVRSYEQLLNNYLLPMFADQRLSEIDAMTVETSIADIVGEVDGQPVRVSTANHALVLMKGICAKAVQPYRLLPYNPVSGILPIPHEAKRDPLLTPAAARRLVESCDGRLKGMVMCGLYAGMRKMEVVGLCEEQIIDDYAAIVIDRQWSEEEGRLKMETKGKKTRVVPIAPALAAFLREWRSLRKTASPLVFHNTNGGPVDGSNLTREFQAALKRSGNLPMGFKGLRSNASSLMQRAKSDPRTRQEFLGHAHVDTTEQYYTQIHQDVLREAVLRMDELLSNG